jgi:MerR family transcriptional regulator, light-induced transcriptional regulator
VSLRIRTIARLTGIREATLRAWERRYGFPSPARGKNNYRTYSREEVEAIRRVAHLLDEGFSTSEAIAQVRSVPLGALPLVHQLRERFWSAVAVLDTEGAEAVLSEAQALMTAVAFSDNLLLPLLRDMAERLDIAREHLASALVRQRLRALAQAPGPAAGPRAVLACPAGELHEGGLLGLAVHLKARGWRLSLLGADTPVEAVLDAARAAQAEVVALSFVTPRPAEEVERYLRAVVAGSPAPVVVGGPVARDSLRRVAASGAHFGETAEEVAALVPRRPVVGAR